MKKTLVLAELERQMAAELPDRELMKAARRRSPKVVDSGNVTNNSTTISPNCSTGANSTGATNSCNVG